MRAAGGDGGDRDGGGVRGEHGPGAADVVERREQLALGADLLGDRLDHELAAGECREIAHEREARERRAPLLVAAQALLDAPRESRLDARAGALERSLVDVAADHLAAALEQHLGDARPHRAQADDAHASDRFHARER